MAHFMSNLVILAASVFEISCGKNRHTDKQTNEVRTLPHYCRQHA